MPSEGLSQEFKRFITEFKVGNFILFSRNTIHGPHAVKALVDDLKGLLKDLNMPPPLISVDQEGGRVSRLGPPHWPQLPSFASIGKTDEPDLEVERIATQCARMLLDAGINVNLAPCLDIMEIGQNPVLKDRCFSHDPHEVTRLGAIYIETLQRQGVLAVAKHFPGIGSLDFDPHTSTSRACATPNRQKKALLPFHGAVRAGVFGIMTSHVLIPCFDAVEIATFSPEIVKLARVELGFEGILFTDDLFMTGAMKDHGLGRAGARALAAGHDMLLYCHDPMETEKALLELIERTEKDNILKKRVARSSERIRLKKTHTLRS